MKSGPVSWHDWRHTPQGTTMDRAIGVAISMSGRPQSGAKLTKRGRTPLQIPPPAQSLDC